MSNSMKWDYLHLVCGECGKEFDIHTGPWGTFYGCQGYAQQTCFNRFTTQVYEQLLEKVSDKVVADGTAAGFEIAIRRSRLRIEAKVIKETPAQVTLAVTNLAQRTHRRHA